MPWKVLAVRYATLASTRSQMYLGWSSYGEPDGPLQLDYYFWLLREGERSVIVDCGFHPDAGARRGRAALITPASALSGLGVRPELVETVILTHLHYDHIGNVGLFPNATILVPAVELDFWSSAVAARHQFAMLVEPDEIAKLTELERVGRVRRFGGDAELLDGVTALSLPGHSPGQHGLLVKTRTRPVLLASDAIHLHEELTHDWAFSMLSDLTQMYGSYDRIRELQAGSGAVVIPGHDPAVMRDFPADSAETARFAVRLS